MSQVHTPRGRARRAAAAAHERDPDATVDLGPLPRLLGYTLRRAHQVSWRTYADVIGEQKLRPGLFSLLVLVHSNPGICQIDLGTHLGVDKASMVALLDQLEHATLIERRRSIRDRRRQGIFLTASGARELESLMHKVRQLERQMASRFTKAELEQFLAFLQRFYS
ncbi:MAG: winged helix-turn-helix transcriptional regulator [Gammaproteobacteria bacterium]|nr:winged helix-turn-helix transcriptional regulator [Gammaproteobacteria bacterium]